MPFPPSWPPPAPTGRHSLRFFVGGTATANYEDNAYIFGQDVGASPVEPLPVVPAGQFPTPGTIPPPPTPAVVPRNWGTTAPYVWASTIRIYNDGAGTITFSFDGTNDHGTVLTTKEAVFRNRYEAGICVKGTGNFRIEAW